MIKLKDLIKEGVQRDRNNLALYIIDLNNMLSNAKILQKRKDPKAKIYIKMIQQDLKDAKKKLSKLKKVKEGTCGYGIDGELGDTPAGPHLMKKKKKTDKEMFKSVKENTCINCGNIVDENLKQWFSDKWVNIGKKKKGGGHPPCGTSGKKRGYAKCVPKSKAAGMSKKQKASATRRKRAAQNKAGRGGTSSLKGGGKKPIMVSTKPKNKK